jgi:hypothetical protein
VESRLRIFVGEDLVHLEKLPRLACCHLALAEKRAAAILEDCHIPQEKLSNLSSLSSL